MKSSANNEIRDYFKILKEDPSSRVFAPLAEALVRRGRLDEAEKICQLGLEANPDFSDGHLAYARVLYYLFRYQEALEQVKLTLASAAGSVEAYLIAAEIFLARSQHKPASDACLKAIDIDPENIEARQILKRINIQAQEEESGARPARPARPSTSKFRATAGTAPSRRLQESNGSASLADPFRQLLQETGKAGSGKLDRMEQPFSALSPGSYPSDDREFGEAVTSDLDDQAAPTERQIDRPEESQDEKVLGLKKYRRDGTPIPKLPEHPPEPGDLLAKVPLMQAEADVTDPGLEDSPHYVPPGSPATEPPPPSAVPGPGGQDSDLPGVDSIQSLIDSYSLRSEPEAVDPGPIKMPRSGRLLVLLFVLFSVGAIVGLLLLGFGRDHQAVKPAETPTSGPPAPVSGTDEPIPLPDQPPVQTAQPDPQVEPEAKPENEAAPGEMASEPPAPEPEKVEQAAAVKPKPKRIRRRRKRSRRRRRRRVKRKKKKKKKTRRR